MKRFVGWKLNKNNTKQTQYESLAETREEFAKRIERNGFEYDGIDTVDSGAAYIVYVDGTIEEVVPKNYKYFDLAELQHYVRGYIEIIPLNEKISIVVNEEGRIKELKFNSKATSIFKRDYLLGNVMFVPNKYLR